MKHSYISQIRDYCAKHAFRYTQHFMQRIIQRDIKLKDVETALVCGEIIEDYPDDKRVSLLKGVIKNDMLSLQRNF